MKIVKNPTMEMGKQSPNSFDIELLGCECLKECNVDYIAQAAINEEICCFSSQFKNKENFFYKLAKTNINQEVILSEVGIGNVKKNILHRIVPLYYANSDGAYHICRENEFINFTCYHQETLFVSQYLPQNFVEMLYEPHSVIISTDVFIPKSIQLSKNSVLGRLNKQIENIPITSLLNQVLKYDEQSERVQFFNGKRWITLVEEKNEDSK
jgi:hypothetical protein